MSTIVAGHFQLQDQVAHARDELIQAGFPEGRISAFFLNQPGQHDMTAIGGDHMLSPGAHESPNNVVKGAATGGAVGAAIGLATAPVTGPLGPAAWTRPRSSPRSTSTITAALSGGGSG